MNTWWCLSMWIEKKKSPDIWVRLDHLPVASARQSASLSAPPPHPHLHFVHHSWNGRKSSLCSRKFLRSETSAFSRRSRHEEERRRDLYISTTYTELTGLKLHSAIPANVIHVKCGEHS